jgi:hypothetical protein
MIKKGFELKIKIIDLSAIGKNYEEFTDVNLFNDTQYQIYWYDADGSNSIYIGDYLKVKTPDEGDYFLQGKIEWAESYYAPIFGEEIKSSNDEL